MKLAFALSVVVFGTSSVLLSGCDQWDDQVTPSSLLDASTDALSHGDGASSSDAGSPNPESPDGGRSGGSGDANDAAQALDANPGVDVNTADASSDI